MASRFGSYILSLQADATDLVRGIGKGVAATAKLTGAQAALGSASRGSALGLGAAGGAALSAGVAFTAVSAAVRGAISSHMDFEQSMQDVLAVSQATEGEMKSLSNRARELGATTKFTATQAGEGMLFLSMAGLSAQDSLEAITDSLHLAAAGNLELASAADIVTNVMSGLQLAASDVGKIADVLALAASSANTNVEQLGVALSYVGPVGSKAGLELEDLAAAIGVLSDNGIQAERAGTGLRAVIASLLNPTGKGQAGARRLGSQRQEHGRYEQGRIACARRVADGEYHSVRCGHALREASSSGGPCAHRFIPRTGRLAREIGGRGGGSGADGERATGHARGRHHEAEERIRRTGDHGYRGSNRSVAWRGARDDRVHPESGERTEEQPGSDTRGRAGHIRGGTRADHRAQGRSGIPAELRRGGVIPSRATGTCIAASYRKSSRLIWTSSRLRAYRQPRCNASRKRPGSAKSRKRSKRRTLGKQPRRKHGESLSGASGCKRLTRRHSTLSTEALEQEVYHKDRLETKDRALADITAELQDLESTRSIQAQNGLKAEAAETQKLIDAKMALKDAIEATNIGAAGQIVPTIQAPVGSTLTQRPDRLLHGFDAAYRTEVEGVARARVSAREFARSLDEQATFQDRLAAKQERSRDILREIGDLEEAAKVYRDFGLEDQAKMLDLQVRRLAYERGIVDELLPKQDEYFSRLEAVGMNLGNALEDVYSQIGGIITQSESWEDVWQRTSKTRRVRAIRRHPRARERPEHLRRAREPDQTAPTLGRPRHRGQRLPGTAGRDVHGGEHGRVH